MSTLLPPAPARTDPPPVFVPKADAFVAALVPFQQDMNALQVDVTAKQVLALTSASTAVDNAQIAVSAATNAAASANATMWVGGKTYAKGDQVFSPINFNVYIRKTNGAGTVDPSNDSINWRNATTGLTLFSTYTTSTIMPSGVGGYYSTVMSSAGQSITLPSALSLSVVSPCIVVDNRKGNYPVGVRNPSGKLLTAIGVGGVLSLSLKDNSTVNGDWGLDGVGLEPGLVTIDVILPKTIGYNNVSPLSVAFNEDVSLHFTSTFNNSYAAFVVDNASKTVSTPIVVTLSQAGMILSNVYRINSTSAVLLYGFTNDSYSVVITLTGTIGSYSLSVSTAARYLTTGSTFSSLPWGNENGISSPKVCQLTPTLYLSLGQVSSSNSLQVGGFSLTGTTVTYFNFLNISSLVSLSSGISISAINATSALIMWQDGFDNPFRAVIVTVIGNTLSLGTVASTPINYQPTGDNVFVQLSASKYIVLTSIAASDLYAHVLNTTGATTCMFSSALLIPGGARINYTGATSNASRYNPLLSTVSASSALLLAPGLTSNSDGYACVLTEINTGTPSAALSLTSTTLISKSVCQQILPFSNSETISISPSASSGKMLTPILVTGSTVSLGNKSTLQYGSSVFTYDSFTKLPSGDYIVQVSDGVEIFRSNGANITKRGKVALTSLPTGLVKTAVSSTRVVLVNNASTINDVQNPASLVSVVNLEVAV